MLAVFYQFNKRVNSLKTPTNADQTISGEVVLKQATSYKNPTLTLACSAEDMSKARLSNYLAFDNKYYWITNTMQISNSHIQFECKIDVLATYKNEILLSKAYVMYSESHGNIHTTDSRNIAQKKNLLKVVSAGTSDIFTTNPLGLLLIANNVGFDLATPYLFTGAETQYLKQKLYAPDFFEQFKQYFSNPLETVAASKVTAANIELNSTSLENVYVGDYDLGVSGHRISVDRTLESTKTLKLDWNYNDYRNGSPFTEAYLYLPFVGYQSIDCSLLYNTKNLTIVIKVEVVTGAVVYTVYADRPESSEAVVLVGIYSGNCNADMPIAQVTQVNPISLGSAAIATAAGLASANPVVTAYGLSQAAPSFRQVTQVHGGISSSLGSKLNLQIMLELWSAVTNDNPDNYKTVMGLPYCSTVELKELSGFTQTTNASISIAADYDEIREVNDLLNGGVYIE